MTRNVGGIDRYARIGGGIVLLALGLFVLPGGWNVAAFIVGIVALATGVFGYCPANAVMGIDTSEGGSRGVPR
ncbi:MAG TPA: DUF2892 domain-containing protein [Pelomicrobium sp.]|nr:DUF2892 domain-containing protein [Pelomicrobium sp.]